MHLDFAGNLRFTEPAHAHEGHATSGACVLLFYPCHDVRPINEVRVSVERDVEAGFASN